MTDPAVNDGLCEQGPILHGERCVHALAPAASCRACVKACPHGAWILDASSLNIDLGACDGCGLCQAACPEGAIEIEAKPSLRQQAEGLVAFAACERAGVAGQDGVLPCLHALGLRALLAWYQEGVRHFVLAHGDCSTCLRGSADRLEAVIERVNLALDERGLETISSIHCAIDDWNDRKEALDAAPKGPAMTRRGLLRLVAEAATRGEGSTGDIVGSAEKALDWPQALLAKKRSTDHLPYQPVIIDARCVGCDACERICPHDAILLEDEDDGACYRSIGERCTGCGLCVDVCEEDAIRIDVWAAAPPPIVPLKAGRCRGCGAAFHKPSHHQQGRDLCRVCQFTSHRRKLYQVLD